MTKDPELYETEAGNKVTTITVAVPRTFKNSDGVYEANKDSTSKFWVKSYESIEPIIDSLCEQIDECLGL